MILVVDASVAVKWLLWRTQIEPDYEIALRILEESDSGRIRIMQPPHWRAEVLAVIARLEPAMAGDALDLLNRAEKQVLGTDAVYTRAVQLSHRLGHHLFDTLYHAVALEAGARLVTADERYFSVAKSEGAIQSLSDFKIA